MSRDGIKFYLEIRAQQFSGPEIPHPYYWVRDGILVFAYRPVLIFSRRR